MATDIFDWNDLDAAIQGTNGSSDTGDYVLQNGLDSSTAGYSGVGDSWQPCGYNATGNFDTGFQGSFDGQGFEIRDLVIDDTSHDTTKGRVGLFGSTNGSFQTAVIENLGVRGTIDSPNNSGFGFGLIVGNTAGTDELRNCYTEGEVSAPSGTGVGGAIGVNKEQTTNCYSLVDATGGEDVGGFCGRNNGGTIQTSYSAGSVTGNTAVGGFTGSASTETDCYWDTEASGQSTSAGSATGLTTSEMQGASASTNLPGFDFSATWGTVESTDSDTSGDGYPILQAITRKTQLQAQGVFNPALNPNLTMGGDDIVEITIDGTAVKGLTIDGDPVE